MGADLGVPLSDLRPLCVSVAGGESRKTFTQFSKRENVKTRRALPKQDQPGSASSACLPPVLPVCPALSCMGPKVVHGRGPGGAPLGPKAPLCVGGRGGESQDIHPIF